MMNALDIDEFNILEIYNSEQYYKFVVELANEPIHCSICRGRARGVNEDGERLRGVYKVKDKRTRTVKDIDLRGKRVVIEINYNRYFCPDCDGVFIDYMNSIEPNDKITLRLFDYMGKESIKVKVTFSSLAEQFGLSVPTVKKSFDKRVQELESKRVLIAPTVLGIDEVYINLGEKRKTPCAVYTDIETRELIEFHVGISKEQVIETIKKMKGYENIVAVTMDMNSGYRSAVHETLPKSYCVVDRFHVMQKCIMALDTIRKQFQGDKKNTASKELFNAKGLIRSNRDELDDGRKLHLDYVLEKYPKLKESYWLKEKLRDVYQCTSKYDAFQLFFQWEQLVPTKGNPEFKGIQRMINSMKQEIFNYFDGKHTNAFTESFNNIVKRTVRLGVGYSFDVLRAKLLYGSSATVVKKVKDMNWVRMYNAMLGSSKPIMTAYQDPGVEKYPTKNSYRVNIDRLLNVLGDGDF